MTVEAAFALIGMVTVVLALGWCLGLLGAQAAVGDAARAAVRAAARGEAPSAVRDEARRLVPGADVDIRVEGDHVVVEVARSVSPPGALARWGAVHLHAEAVALLESPA